jgi:hypothetical protein
MFSPHPPFWGTHFEKADFFSHEANLRANDPFCVSFLKASPPPLLHGQLPLIAPYFLVHSHASVLLL